MIPSPKRRSGRVSGVDVLLITCQQLLTTSFLQQPNCYSHNQIFEQVHATSLSTH
jgi:hypothetical protein